MEMTSGQSKEEISNENKDAMFDTLPEPSEAVSDFKSHITLEPLTIPNDTYSDDTHQQTSQHQSQSHFTAPATPLLLVPSLRGHLFVDVSNNHVCQGVWGMSDDAHNYGGQTSEFEFRLIKASDNTNNDSSVSTIPIANRNSDSTYIPVNGRYQGWFTLKQAPPLKPTAKIDDKDMNITFTARTYQENDDDHTSHDAVYTVVGEGVNRFGTFHLNGYLCRDGRIQMYRTYSLPSVATSASKSQKKRPLAGAGSTSPTEKLKKKVTVHPTAVVDPNTPASTKEVASRPRPKKSFEFEDKQVAAPVNGHSTPHASKTPKTPASSYVSQQQVNSAVDANAALSNTGRSVRLSLPLQKCVDLLKEFMKHPQALWFLTPVDHEQLQLPDYPLIITQPMDFGTIKTHLSNNIYNNNINFFAEEMRLVFRNAMTYNVSVTHPVHVAAKELGARFEERFRVLLATTSTTVLPGEEGFVLGGDLQPTTPSLKKLHKAKSGNTISAALTATVATSATSSIIPAVATTPKVGKAAAALPAPLDPNAHYLIEMQRRMEDMQNEIFKLRTAVRQNEIHQQLQQQQQAAHHPLTLEEKKALIGNINRLTNPQQQHQVFDIIRQSTGLGSNDDDDVEVPLDQLDTLTLRKLQQFVETCLSEKQQQQQQQRREVNVKKPKRERTAATTPRSRKPKAAPLSIEQQQNLYTLPSNSSSGDAANTSLYESVSVTREVSFQQQQQQQGSDGNNDSMLVDDDNENDDEHGDDDEELLFGAESFEVLRSRSYTSDNNDANDDGEKDDEEDNNKQTPQEVNTDAWIRGAGSNNNNNNIVSANSTSSNGSTSNASVWNSAVVALEERKRQELVVKEEELKLAEMRMSNEINRITTLQQQQQKQQQEQLRLQQVQQQQREEERLKLANMKPTVQLTGGSRIAIGATAGCDDAEVDEEEMHMFIEGSHTTF